MDKSLDEIEQELRRVRLTRLYRFSKEKYRYYSPIGKVEPFINAVGSGDYLIIAGFMANGVGKTACGVNILANLIWPCGNPFFQTRLFKEWPYPKKIRIVAPANTIKETIIPEMENWFPHGRYHQKYEKQKDGKSYNARWISDTGWQINIMTYDQAATEFESATLGIVWFDEPPPEEIFTANISRLRKGGVMFITATPLIGSAWMYDKIYVKKSKNMTYFHADIEDACIEHGERGFLQHATIVQMLENYDPDELKARAFGKFQHLSGLIFKKFSTKIHVIEPFDLDPKEWCVYLAHDTHPRVNEAISFCAVNKEGTKIIVDEIWREGETPEIASWIKHKEGYYRMVKRLLEPAGFVVDKRTGRSFASDLSKFGLNYVPGSKRRNDAIKKTKAALNYKFKNNMWIKEPELYVFSTCTQHIWEFTHWQWNEWVGKSAERKGLNETPQDKNDHMMENVGRLMLENMVFIPDTTNDYNGGQRRKSDDPYDD